MSQNLAVKNEESEGTFAANERIATVILFVLLLVRLVDQYLPFWIFGANVPDWYAYWYVGIAYILTVTIVWLNRHRLTSLNIDRPFVIALMIGGFLYLFYLTPDIGVPVAITAAFVFWAYQNNHFLLKNTIEYASGTMLLILFAVFLALLPIVLFNLAATKPVNFQLIFTLLASTFRAELALMVFEEVVFRGALWAYLRDLGLKDLTIFLTQAFIFWLAHSKYMFLENPYSFWVAAPLISVLLGFIVWRSKSLTASTTAHFLFNFTSVLLRNLF